MKFTRNLWGDRTAFVLAIIPLLLLVIALFINRMIGRPDADPEYVYLLNGLEALTLHPPNYFDHPGTTLVVFIALIELVAWLFSLLFFNPVALVTSVISQPDWYLHVITPILLVIAGAAVFFMGRRVWVATGSLSAGLVGQGSVLLSFSVLISMHRISPEPLLLASTMVLAGFLAPFVFKPEAMVHDRRLAALVGGTLGFCVATKITAMPLVFSLLLLPNLSLKKTALGWFVGAGLIFTIPIAHHYRAMLGWFFRVFSHTNTYGSGPIGVPAAVDLWSNLLTLMNATPEIFVAVAIYGVVYFLSPESRVRRAVAVSAIILCAQIVMVVKSPAARYLLPCIAIIALTNAALAWDFWSRRSLSGLGKVVLSTLFAACLLHTAWVTWHWIQESHQIDQANAAVIARAETSGCEIVPFYPVKVPVYGLDFGNASTNYHFTYALKQSYPDVVIYDALFKTFRRGFGKDSVTFVEIRDRFAKSRCVYLVGGALERFGESPFAPGALRLVTKTPYGLGDALALYALNPASLSRDP